MVGIAKPTNNNIVERLHGTIREREKVMRAMKKDETAEKAEIISQINGNKWLELIRLASKRKVEKPREK